MRVVSYFSFFLRITQTGNCPGGTEGQQAKKPACWLSFRVHFDLRVYVCFLLCACAMEDRKAGLPPTITVEHLRFPCCLFSCAFSVNSRNREKWKRVV